MKRHSRPAWGSQSCVFLHVTKMLLLCASSGTPISLQRCCQNQQAASCTAPLRRAPNQFLQQLCSNIAVLDVALNLFFFNALPRTPNFDPHAVWERHFSEGENIMNFNGNVLPTATRSMPFLDMYFEHKPEACFYSCILKVVAM